jgi:hypothetical protein
MAEFEEAQKLYVFPTLVTGTTLLSQAFVVEINDAAPTATLASVSCVFSKDGAITLTVTCTVTSAALWNFTVGPVAASSMALAPGLHEGYIETTDSAGTVRKYVKTQLNILP